MKKEKEYSRGALNVLSLFDGCATGLQVLKDLGITVKNYFAAEIDKPAMSVAKDNHPEIKHIGSVTDVFAKDLPQIDLLIGGSPCQGFSFAGKQLNFDDPRSALFWEYVRLLKECNPKYFFLENVRMDKRSQEVISEALNCEPIAFNSKLVCAQSRPRLYWTNLAAVQAGLFGRVKFGGYIPTKDKGIVINDILQNDVDVKYFVTGKQLNYATSEYRRKKKFTSLDAKKANCLMAKSHESWNENYVTKPKRIADIGGNSGGNHSDMDLLSLNDTIRRLTEIEAERLQGLPDNYTKAASKTQRYKMLGNGWQADTIKLFLKYLKLC